ncbi:MAG: flap endonuclease [Ruminococcaceae bacterium]|nr:flap endonuclease [Oscillospiraceae bacterium]
MTKLLLVDGSNLLFQMFYGMPSRIIGKDGSAIQGTLGFVGALLKIIRQVSPSHVAVFFDGECKNERKELDSAYKSNRPDFSELAEDEIPFSQLPGIYAALDFLGIKHAETTVCETDDIIAGYALTFGSEFDVVISSFDSDFFQLISDHVSILRYRGDNTVICTPDYIRNKLGIEPGQYADHKSLTGDSSDNIKGADKVGPKTATELIRKFGTLEGVIANAKKIKKPSVRASVLASVDRLRLNYRLIKLDGCAELPFAFDELEYLNKGYSTTQVLREIALI